LASLGLALRQGGRGLRRHMSRLRSPQQHDGRPGGRGQRAGRRRPLRRRRHSLQRQIRPRLLQSPPHRRLIGDRRTHWTREAPAKVPTSAMKINQRIASFFMFRSVEISLQFTALNAAQIWGKALHTVSMSSRLIASRQSLCSSSLSGWAEPSNLAQ